MTATTISPELAEVPPAPVDAYEPADWHDVPKGFYAIPVHDWMKFGDDCYPDAPSPVLDLLGYTLFTRKVPTEIKTGKRAGRKVGKDQFVVGRPILAEGVEEYVIHFRRSDGTREDLRYTPLERLTRACRTDRWGCEHDIRDDGDGSVPCRCSTCAREGNYEDHWKAVPNQREAYANTVAAVILDGIANHDDIYRKLYGQLTGQCGICGRLLSDPESKLRGIGPECLRHLNGLLLLSKRQRPPDRANQAAAHIFTPREGDYR